MPLSPTKGRVAAGGKTKKKAAEKRGPSPRPLAAQPLASHAEDARSDEASALLAAALNTSRTTARKGGSEPLPDRLLLGITLAGLEDLLSTRDDAAVAFAKTVAKRPTVDGYVNAVLCRQDSQEDDLSTCQRLEDGDLAECIGRANIFVSWPFCTELETLIGALQQHVGEAGLEPDSAFFWISDFSLCQTRLAADLPRLPEIVGAIGNTLMIMEPWDTPEPCVPLSRAFCLWELYHTAKAQGSFKVVMSPAQAEAFEGALVENFEAIQAALGDIDLRTAECARKQDKEMIVESVSRGIGADAFNALVSKLMSGAIADQAVAVVERLGGDERANAHQLLGNTATLLGEAGDLARAEALHREALHAVRARVGDYHVDTLHAMTALANLLQDKGDLAAAEVPARTPAPPLRAIRLRPPPRELRTRWAALARSRAHVCVMLAGDDAGGASREP